MYAYIHDVPINLATYRRIVDRLGPEPLPGSLLHLCVRRPDGGLRYIELWESEAACSAAFRDRIHPAVDAVLAGTGLADHQHTVSQLEVLHATGRVTEPVAI